MKRLLHILLILCTVCALLPAAAMADVVSPRNTYRINGVDVHYDDVQTKPNECLQYASDIYELLWGFEQSTYKDDPDNYVRDVPAEELTLNEENLKKYITQAALGSVIRVTHFNELNGHDVTGHSQVLVQKDDEGFTVLEGGIAAYPHCREKYYTWEQYVSIPWLGGTYEYIKYIKHPGAPTVPEVREHEGAFTVLCGAKNAMAEPWKSSLLVRTVEKGSTVQVVGYLYDEGSTLWYKTAEGDYLTADYLAPEGSDAPSGILSLQLKVDCRSKPLRAGPGADATIRDVKFEDNVISIRGYMYDAEGELWYETEDGLFLYWDELSPLTPEDRALLNDVRTHIDRSGEARDDYANLGAYLYNRYCGEWYVQALLPASIFTLFGEQ